MRSPAGEKDIQGTALLRKPPGVAMYSNPRSLLKPLVRLCTTLLSLTDSRMMSSSWSLRLAATAAIRSPDGDAAIERQLGTDHREVNALTRGEGGQNSIGGELGAALGIVRTSELLAARERLLERNITIQLTAEAREWIANNRALVDGWLETARVDHEGEVAGEERGVDNDPRDDARRGERKRDAHERLPRARVEILRRLEEPRVAETLQELLRPTHENAQHELAREEHLCDARFERGRQSEASVPADELRAIARPRLLPAGQIGNAESLQRAPDPFPSLRLPKPKVERTKGDITLDRRGEAALVEPELGGELLITDRMDFIVIEPHRVEKLAHLVATAGARATAHTR